MNQKNTLDLKRGKRLGDKAGVLYVLPALIYMLALVGYPIVSNFILSFQDVTVRTINSPNKEFVGFENYIELFSDEVFRKSIGNSLIFTVSCIVFQFVIGFALALFLSRNFTTAKFVRGFIMISWMIPITITGLMFKFMFSTDVGIFNQALMALGLLKAPIDWLTSPETAMTAIILTNIWIGIPFNMILLSTGLATIPGELYESASIDGANRTQTFFKITVPMLRPAIESVLILGFIYTFKVFDLVYVMTNGGPVNSTHLLSTYSYKQSFELFKYSKGAATANVLFVILLIASMIYLKISYSEDDD